MFLNKFKPYNKLKRFFQRGKKGYCYQDLWDLYDWFTGIFPIMLEDFMKNSQGYPAPYPSKCVDNEEFWYKEQRRRWEYEVKKLIWFLKEANDYTCSQTNDIVYDVRFEFEEENKEKGWSKLNIVYPTKEDEAKSKEYGVREKEILEYKNNCFHEALVQFEKIARDLWD